MEYPSSSDNFFQNKEKQLQLSPSLKFFRWLDKAAIIECTPEQDEQKKAGRLCTVTQVKECKIFLTMIPIWTAFLGFGLLLSTGDNFFSEQANDMYHSVLPVLVFQRICQLAVRPLYKRLLRFCVPEPKRKQAKIVRFWAGMVVSTFCFSVAWRVEVHRLQIVKKHALENKPNATVPMSTFWLAPQYCLLGLMEGLVKDGLDEFIIDELPDSWNKYVSSINGFVIDGIGSFLSIASIYGNRRLFASTLNRSRLDKYYQLLTILSFLNLCYYWLISTIYSSYHTAEVRDESVESNSELNIIYINE